MWTQTGEEICGGVYGGRASPMSEGRKGRPSSPGREDPLVHLCPHLVLWLVGWWRLAPASPGFRCPSLLETCAQTQPLWASLTAVKLTRTINHRDTNAENTLSNTSCFVQNGELC